VKFLRASWRLALLTAPGIAAGTIIPYTWIEKQLNMLRGLRRKK